MSQSENTETITWGGVIRGDTIVAPDGREWLVTGRAGACIYLSLLGSSESETASATPPAGAACVIRIRPQVPVREAIETIAAAFPDATADAHLRDPFKCEACGAWVCDLTLHKRWHNDLTTSLTWLHERPTE